MDLLGDIVLVLQALFVLGCVQNAVNLVIRLVALDCSLWNVPTQSTVIIVDVVLVIESDFNSQGSYTLSNRAIVEGGQVGEGLNELRKVAVFEGDTEVAKHV